MYADHRPCLTCGAEVRLEERTPSDHEPGAGEPVGPPDGVVGSGDPTLDRRVCTNPDCPTHRGGGEV